MSTQKLLWVLLSVLAVLAIVLFAAMFLYNTDGATADVTGEGAEFASGYDALEYSRSERENPSIGDAPDFSPKPSSDAEEDPNERTAEEEPQIDEAVADGTDKENETSESVVTVREKETQTSSSTNTIQQSEPKEKQSSTRTSAASVRKAEPAPRKPEIVTQYWIQTGSFSSMIKARESVEQLNQRGFLNARILTAEINSSIAYRVRIGPYTNKNEANKFKDWVRKLAQFSGAYVTEVYVKV